MEKRPFDRNTEKNTRLIGFLKTLMVCTGTWSYHWTDNFILKKLYHYFFFFPLSVFGAFYIAIIMELFRVLYERDKLDKLLLNLGIVLDASKITIRLFFYFKNNVLAKFKNIMRDEQDIFESQEPELIFLYITTCLCSYGYMIIEISDNILVNRRHKANNESVEPPFLYQIYYPNPVENRVSLYCVNCFMVTFIILAVNVSFGISTTCMVYGATQLEIFQIRLKRIHEIAEKSYNGDVALTLKTYIVKHQDLMTFILDLNDCIRSATLGEFLISSINCASVVADITKVSDIGLDATYSGCYVVLLISQIFTYASAASEIKIQSAAIADAIYECEWYNFDKNSQKMINILQSRAQKPLEMTIGPFGAMTNETAVMMMKACYSYVAFMKDSGVAETTVD
ncbi:odorant receptor 24a-like isoform X2 [Rhynchophorus ferrugineus]|uniref:odorant receptor 24a-like isoform X2 n=1 Tax=Rhynchophorus ferrugineus TaxID=354439 RepID=UPI003FCD266D